MIDEKTKIALDELTSMYCSTGLSTTTDSTITINGVGGERWLTPDEFLVWLDGFLDGREELNQEGINRITSKLRFISRTISTSPVTFPSRDPFIHQQPSWNPCKGPTCSPLFKSTTTDEDLLTMKLRK